MITDALINPNSPEIVLGSWLEEVSAAIADHSFVVTDYDETKSALLAILLEFADQHNKLCELFHWLTSLEGHEFLRRKEYQVAGNMLKGELFMLDDDDEEETESSNIRLLHKLRNFIEDHFVNTKYRPYLRA